MKAYEGNADTVPFFVNFLLDGTEWPASNLGR